MNNLPKEKAENSFKDVIMQTRAVIKYYIPLNKKQECNSKMFNQLLQISTEKNLSRGIKNEIFGSI